MLCDDCGGELKVGVWPFCGGDASKHVVAGRFGEDPLEPYFDEMISAEGMWFSNRGERRKYMDRNGIDFKEKQRAADRPTLYFDMRGK